LAPNVTPINDSFTPPGEATLREFAAINDKVA
jgi:hypothetical protein